MTFTVATRSEDREHSLGTIWAAGETEARLMASSLFPEEEAGPNPNRLVLRRAEEREIPLRMMN